MNRSRRNVVERAIGTFLSVQQEDESQINEQELRFFSLFFSE